ncbi:unnamed protein product [Mytilus coruscus]|uniref:Tyr recombinase domain-containing protein n=1 Tax=Mytilus coruscus TaxID=42192 RepID=A0A6J8EHI6_MYTCO|nr:unnamed protein product [Mytilus coruscus]
MSGRGKGVRSRRNRVSPYANIAISDRQWDLNNPSNWTIQKFREELDKKRHKDTNTSGISTPQIQQNRTISDNDTSIPSSAEPEVATDSGIIGQPLASMDINNISVPNTSSTEQDTTSVNHQVPSSNTDGITSDIPMQNSNFNCMATMSTMLAHCFSGFQQSLNQFNQNLNKGTNTDSSGFSLQQWYKAQSSTTNHMDQVPNVPMFQTGLQQDSIYPSSTVQQLDARASSTQHGFQGIRSDSFSNVDIISPTLQKQIIEVRESLYQNLPSDPLFISQNSLALERNYFINCIKQVLSICGFNPDHYNGHSLRIGAATTAGKAHIEDHLVKILGRWSSDSYCRYIRVSSTSIKYAQDLLGKY